MRPTAPAENEAVRFFIDRAQAVRPDFTLTDEKPRAVAEICLGWTDFRLAIELAAALVKDAPT